MSSAMRATSLSTTDGVEELRAGQSLIIAGYLVDDQASVCNGFVEAVDATPNSVAAALDRISDRLHLATTRHSNAGDEVADRASTE